MFVIFSCFGCVVINHQKGEIVTVGVSTPGVPGPTSKIVAACPSLDGLARDGTQRGENRGSCYPAPEWVRLQ
jgi:hypothetical protein